MKPTEKNVAAALMVGARIRFNNELYAGRPYGRIISAQHRTTKIAYYTIQLDDGIKIDVSEDDLEFIE